MNTSTQAMPEESVNLPVRILVTPGMGGANAWALRLRRRLGMTREVSIICQGDPSDLAEPPDFAYTKSRDLGRWLRSTGEAIVFPNWIWSAYPLCSRLRERGTPLRTVACCRSHDESSYYSKIADRLSHIDWIVSVSAESARELVQRFPTHADRVRHIPTFVDRPDSLRRSYSHGPLRLLYSGRIEQLHKRALDLVDLAELLIERDVDFTLSVAGTGVRTDEFLRKMREVRHRGRIRLIGEIRHDEMPAVYLDHDVFVQCSDTEGLSNSMLEAMAHGVVPVVTRANDEVLRVVDHGANGFVSEVGDLETMAATIAQLSDRPESLVDIGRRAHSATADYSWAAYEPRFCQLLADVERALD